MKLPIDLEHETTDDPAYVHANRSNVPATGVLLSDCYIYQRGKYILIE